MNYTNYFEFPHSARQNQKFVSVMDGYNKGNLLAGEYVPYRNYEPKLPINTTDKENAMMTIQVYDFGCNDLILYLDVHPEDKEALNLFRIYQQRLEEAVSKYTIEYGPIYSDQIVLRNTWNWFAPWPFERGES